MAEWTIAGLAFSGAVLTFAIKFGSLEIRVNKLEEVTGKVADKLDRISESLARIEGQLGVCKHGSD